MWNEQVIGNKKQVLSFTCYLLLENIVGRDVKPQGVRNMKRNHGRCIGIAVLLVALTLTGCPTTKTSAKTAGDEVGNAAVDEAADAVSDNVRQEVREGVNDTFKDILGK
jgi:hypothetical protein